MKPLIAAPPNKKIISNTMNVVIEVLIVLDNVEFNAIFICLFSSDDLCNLKFSRILSNTTTVSFIEYPITVSIAAIKAWSTSKLKGKIPCKIAKAAKTIVTSCSIAIIAPVEYCHLPKRNNIYAKTASKDKIMAHKAEDINSLETVAETDLDPYADIKSSLLARYPHASKVSILLPSE